MIEESTDLGYLAHHVMQLAFYLEESICNEMSETLRKIKFY